MGKRLKLAYDARPAQVEGVGVASYSRSLIQHLDFLRAEFDLAFLIDQGLPTDTTIFPSGAEFIKTTVGRGSKWHRDLWTNAVLPGLLRQRRVHLFHGLDYHIPIRPCGCVRVATFHDAIVFGDHDARRFLERTWLRFLFRRMARAADAVVTDSEYSRQDLLRHISLHSENVVTVWSGVSKTYFQPVRGDLVPQTLTKLGFSGPYLLYFGGYAPRKNVGTLIEAFRIVSERHWELRLVFVGSTGGPYRKVLEHIRRLGLEDRTSVFGFAQEEEIKILLDRCALFVFPSQVEGFGLPAAEAMACGAAVVCSSGGSLHEIVSDAARVVDCSRPAPIAEAMIRLLDDEEERGLLIRRARQRAELFRWERTVEKLVDVYRRCLGRKSFEAGT